MAFTHSDCHIFSFLIPFLPSPTHKRASTFLFRLRLKNSRNALHVLSCSSPQQQEILQFVANSDEKTLPCVRIFENDLARLSLVGSVSSDQAVTAAAADGGEAAAEHLDSGVSAMVIETVFPVSAEEHATVATRLFLPARKVKEKVNKLRRSVGDDFLSGSSSQNILVMTFRQVVMHRLWNFELVMLRPGTERNMDNLSNPREVPVSFSLSSSDERVISALAEAVCICALQSTERQYLNSFLGKPLSNFFHFFQTEKKFVSKDSLVIIYKLLENEMIENGQSLLETFNLTKASSKYVKMKPKYCWWTTPVLSKLEKIGGPGFTAWTSDHIPAYRLQISTDGLKDVKFEGWRKSTENRWEALLTHSQMVGLSNILDMYYEDPYSLPDKQLSCGVVTNAVNLPNKKRNSSLMNKLSIIFASGIFLIIINALGHFCLPYVFKGQKYPRETMFIASSEIDNASHQSLDAAKLETFCTSVVQKIKDAFGWPDDIITEVNVGAWIGKMPSYLKQYDPSGEENSIGCSAMERTDADMKFSAQDIASYQVVLSTDGKMVGFQPTSRVGVNHWAANPLAKELYGGKRLSPGIIESGLQIPLPDEVVALELLMSIKSDAYFAFARPFR